MTLLTPRTLLLAGAVVTAVSVVNPAAASRLSLQDWMDSQSNQLVAELASQTDQNLTVTSWEKSLRGKVTAKLDLVLAEKLGLTPTQPAS